MNFWDLNHDKNRIAIIDPSVGEISYGELKYLCDQASVLIKKNNFEKQLGFLIGGNCISTLVTYLSSLRSNDVVLPINPELDKRLILSLIVEYEPDWIYFDENFSFSDFSALNIYESIADRMAFKKNTFKKTNLIYEELSLLMSTSGSTGSQKLVRISKKSIQSNAVAISSYLGLTESDRAITTLPFYYSYGLSIINTHLQAGASIVLNNNSVLSRDFWHIFKDKCVTSFSGVPFTYEMIRRVNLKEHLSKEFRYMTQAGGAMSHKLLSYYKDLAKDIGFDFFVMYGQTEASPRISYLPPEKLDSKIGSIGIAIPGGSIEIDEDNSEIIYRGDNVMLGYANNRNDLSREDDNKGILRTGDVGYMDSDGFFFIKGRIKRFVKVHGNRYSLDDIEKNLNDEFGFDFAVSAHEENIIIWTSHLELDFELVKKILFNLYKLPKNIFNVKFIANLPRLANGKINYSMLLEND